MEIRTTFHKRLRKIQDDVLVMGSMVEKAIERSIEALKKRDQELAGKIIEDDQAIRVLLRLC
jgi:phosphate transport system protein